MTLRGPAPTIAAVSVSAWVAIGVVGVLVLYVVATYNRLVALRNRIDNAWSQIDVQLRRRYDLIPNLVETVKGYAAHERGVFERVTQARSAGIQAGTVADQAKAENQITQALRQLLAVAEAYPDLKANQNFLALQEELTATEGRISFARQFYNDQVLRSNNLVQQVPSRFVAQVGGFGAREYFQVEGEAAGPVRVQF